jgi:hypothetical protein
MKITNKILFIFFLFAPLSAVADVEQVVIYLQSQPKIPKLVSKAMQPIAKRWELPRYIFKYNNENCVSSEYPYFITGNFDNDIQLDYAFWAEINSGIQGDNRQAINLYVVTSQSGKAVLLEKHYGIELYLDPLFSSKKGTKVYDYEKDKYSILEHDSIGAIICEKSSREWVMATDGAFKRLWTSD